MEHRFTGLSYLRILATVGVICLHTFSTVIDDNSFGASKVQGHFFMAGSLVWSFCVPVFFMITGALLLRPGKQITWKDCIGKYSRRILLALVIFAIPMDGLIRYAEGYRGFSLIWRAVASMITGYGFSHFWYLYFLIGIYLLLPVLKAFVEKAEKKELEYALAVMFVLLFIVPVIRRLTLWRIAFFLPLGYVVFYVLVGYYCMYLLNVKKTPWLYAGIGIITLMLIVCSYTDVLVEEWKNYDDPVIAVEAIFIFLLFKQIRQGRHDAVLWKFDRLCFGVYLIHPLFIQLTYRAFRITPLSAGNLYPAATIGFWILFTAASFAASWLLNLIRPLRKYVL